MALLSWAEDAQARLEGAVSIGGAPAFPSAFVAPPADGAEPNTKLALDHTTNGQTPYPGGSLGGLFNRPGLLAGFAAGFLGAGPLGLLFGHGLFGGLGGVPSFLGLSFQLALLVMLGRLIWTWWNGRNVPVFAGLSLRQQAEAYWHSRNELLPAPPPTSADEAPSDDEATSPRAGSMKST